MILSGYDIRYYINRHLLKIEPFDANLIQQNGIDLVLEELELIQERFYLGCTKEVLTLPRDLMGFVELRSSWARRGILIAPTIVDAGFSGNLTVEIFYVVSSLSIPFPVGKPFLHIIFAKMLSEGDPYRGKYQNQRGITKPK